MLALQPKMRIGSTFCLTLVQASLGMTVDLLAHLIGKQFYK